MEPEVRKRPIRFYEIDALRFLAAVSVVFYHYTFRGYAANNYSPLPFLAIGKFTKYGYLGVELFFIISGYVVLLSAQGKTIRQFFTSRVTRLYPAFWVACSLTFLVEYIWGPSVGERQISSDLHATLQQYAWNMTMLNGFLNVEHIDGVYWSLTVEIRFYLLIALLIISKQMPRIDIVLAAWLAYAAVVGPAAVSHLTHLLMPRYAAYFAAGMLFYLMQKQSGRTWRRYGLLALSYLLAVRSSIERTHEQAAYFQGALSWQVVAGIITLFFAIFLLITFRKYNLSRYSWFAWFGVLTYPLYLVHQNIGYLLFHRLGGAINKYVLLSSTVLLMLILSYGIHVLIEKPLSKIISTKLATFFDVTGAIYKRLTRQRLNN